MARTGHSIQTRQGGLWHYSLYNAAITVLSENEKWEFMLAGRNLGDETILVAGAF